MSVVFIYIKFGNYTVPISAAQFWNAHPNDQSPTTGSIQQILMPNTQ